MDRKVIIRTAAALLALVVVAACGGGSSGGSGSKSTYKIGVILGVTGPTGNLGQHELDGAKLAVDRINKAGGVNGHRLQLVTEDDAGVADNAVNAFNRITSDDSILAIFGSTLGTNTLAMLPLVQKVGIPILAPNSTYGVTHQNNQWIFRVAVPANVEVDAAVSLLKKRGLKKIAVLDSTDAYGSQAADLFKQASGVTVVATESFALTATDLTTQLTKIRAASPDAIVVFTGAPLAGIALKNAGQLGITQPIFSGVASNNPGNISAAANSPALGNWLTEGVLDPANPLPRQKDGFSAIKAAYGYDPDTFACVGWDALYALSTALTKLADNPTRAQVRDAMANVKDFQGVGGVYTWTKDNRDGTTVDSVIWMKAQNGAFVRAV